MIRTCYLSILLAVLFHVSAHAQTVYTVPSANTNSGSTRFPLGAFEGYERSAAIYRQNDIGAFGSISTIAWYVNAVNAPAASTPVEIYMKQRSGNFGGTATTVSAELTGATLVYSGNISATQLTAGGWTTITLTTPFNYLNNNLEVIVLSNYTGTGGGETTTGKQFRYGTLSGANGSNFHQTWSANNTAPAGNGTLSNSRPNIQITITPITSMTYSSSNMAQITTDPVGTGTTEQVLSRLNVVTGGSSSPAIELQDITVSTNGTTSLSDISNLKIFYTGSTATFSNAVQFGTTIPGVAAAQIINGTQQLGLGNNYFWIACDIVSSAVPGDSIDVEVPAFTVDFVSRTPATVAPVGKRPIQARQTFLSAFATQSDTSSAAAGSANNAVLGLTVVTSSTGFPLDLTQLDFNTNGTTDTANIRNIRVWYTGNSKTFGTGNQFGTTLSYLPGTTAFSITGSQALASDTSYFWLTYDVAATAAIGNVLDAECATMIVSGSVWTPVITAPPGSRKTGVAYCSPSYSNSCSSDDFINNFSTTGGISDISNLGSGCNGNPDNYVFYPGHVLTIEKGDTFTFNVRSGIDYEQGFRIWIDYNQDGMFNNTTELIYTSPSASTTAFTGSVTIPCSAQQGFTRMRVRSMYNEVPASACGSEDWGEAEDYPVNILPSAMSYRSSSVIQSSIATAPASATNVVVLRIPVITTGCTPVNLTAFGLTLGATTTASDIASAKIYYTGPDNQFNTGTLFGSGTAASSYTISGSQALLGQDTNNFWLVYDVSASAALNNLLDGAVANLVVNGVVNAQPNGDPAGSIEIRTPMTISTSSVFQVSGRVIAGSANNNILGIRISTSATGAPLPVTQIDLNANGTTDLSDIENIRMWFSGQDSNFVAANQYGPTITSITGSVFSITGNQQLLNGSNYFWLTYDVKSTATATDLIDAGCAGFIAGSYYVPANGTPSGAREVITGDYCFLWPSNIEDSDIGQVAFSVNSVPVYTKGIGCTPATGNPDAFGDYTDYTLAGTVPLPVNTPVDLSICQVSSDAFYETRSAIYIDLNQNGTWDAGEMVWTQAAGAGNGVPRTGQFTIPCSALPGYTRMRVVLKETSTRLTIADACNSTASSFNFGETEDYIVNIVPAPIRYGSAVAGNAAAPIVNPGSTDNPVIKLPVVMYGCGSATLTSIGLNTAGTTNAADINNARIYYTGASNVFATGTLFGSATQPSGAFAITGSQALSGDTNYFWLTYDVASSAVRLNQLDAASVDVVIDGTTYALTSGNPAGTITVDNPMAIVSATVTQQVTGKVELGSADNRLIGIVLNISSGSPQNITRFDLATTGTTNLADISNVKLWYTGSSASFATVNQFGSTIAAPVSSLVTITGSVALTGGDNYFWLTYSIDPAATIGNTVDAECTSVLFGGSAYFLPAPAPAGSREIRPGYCLPSYSTVSCITGDHINRVATQKAVTNFDNNNTSCTVNPSNHTYFASMKASVHQGGSFNLLVRTPGNAQGIKVWIDYDQDGTFNGADEEALAIAPTSALTTSAIIVPSGALTGTTRMRVRGAKGVIPSSPCGLETDGETEDYTIEILPAPQHMNYVWNSTSPASFNTAASWIPARDYPNAGDTLVFGNGSTAVANSVTRAACKLLKVENNTQVTLSGTAGLLNVLGELALNSGRIITSNLDLVLGESGASAGTLSGSGTIEGNFGRWIGTMPAAYEFPLQTGTSGRKVRIQFTAAPSVPGVLQCRFVPGAPGINGLPLTEGAVTADTVGVSGIWRLGAANGLAGGVYEAQFTAGNFAGVNVASELFLVQRTNASSAWTISGLHAATTGTAVAPVLSRLALTSFGEFGVAGNRSVNPLPVALSGFTGKLAGKDALLQWTTATERNNKGFTIEKQEGKVWRTIGFVSGKGNSAAASDYRFTDRDAALTALPQLYYRLRQVDLNGQESLSEVVTLAIDRDPGTGIVLSPNPFRSEVNIIIPAGMQSTAEVTVTDVHGRVVKQVLLPVGAGSRLTVNGLGTLEDGMYFVAVKTGDHTVITKMLKAE